MRKVFIHFLWWTLSTVVLLTIAAFTAIWFGWIGYMPPVEDLQNPIDRFATQVYSADGAISHRILSMPWWLPKMPASMIIRE